MNWIKNDFKAHPTRFVIETLAWAVSISCSLILAGTVPKPPLFVLYPLWIISSCMYGWSAYSRRSFGMLANYVLLVAIDSIGLMRLV